MNLRVATLLGRVHTKLKMMNQSEYQDEDLVDIATQVQDDIFQRCDLERKFDIALVGDQEAYPFTDEETYDIHTKIGSWDDADFEFVPNAQWDKYRNTDAFSYPYYLTIFGQELFVSPIPTASWVSTDNPIITFWGKQKKTIVPIDENTDPEVPGIFDNALLEGIIAWIVPDNMPMYLSKLELAMETYNNKKLGIATPDCDW